MKPVNPDTLAAPRGYNNGMLSQPGRILFIAGQIGWDKNAQLAAGFVAQFDQALANLLETVESAGGKSQHIGRITIYVKDKHDYLAHRQEIGTAYQKRMGKHFPAMTLLVINDLLEDGALLELEATAVLP